MHLIRSGDCNRVVYIVLYYLFKTVTKLDFRTYRWNLMFRLWQTICTSSACAIIPWVDLRVEYNRTTSVLCCKKKRNIKLDLPFQDSCVDYSIRYNNFMRSKINDSLRSSPTAQNINESHDTSHDTSWKLKTCILLELSYEYLILYFDVVSFSFVTNLYYHILYQVLM